MSDQRRFTRRSGRLASTPINDGWAIDLDSRDPAIPNLPLETPAGGSPYSLTCESSTFALSGQAVALRAARLAIGGQATFVLTGQDMGLRVARTMTAGQAAFALSGQTANLRATRVLTGGSATFTLTGQATTLRFSRTLTAASATFALTGQAVTLRATRLLTAVSATFALAGQALGLRAVRALATGQATFDLTGQDATLTYVPSNAYSLTADTGIFALAGQDALFEQGAAPGNAAPPAFVPIKLAARLDRLKQLDYSTLVADSATEADTNASWAKRNWARILRLRVKLVPV